MYRIIKCLLLIFSLIFCLSGCSNVRYKSVPPASKEMKYLLFPTQAYRNTLNRAIIVSGEELYAGSKIAYYVGDNEVEHCQPSFQFMNTGISTYIWILNKNKPAERMDKVQLIDTSRCFEAL